MDTKNTGYLQPTYPMPTKRYCQMLDLKNDPALIAEYKKRQGLVYDRTLVCVTAIEECVAGMPSEMGEILKLHYFQRISLREMSKKYYLGRNTIARRRDKAIAIISDCLSEV